MAATSNSTINPNGVLRGLVALLGATALLAIALATGDPTEGTPLATTISFSRAMSVEEVLAYTDRHELVEPQYYAFGVTATGEVHTYVTESPDADVERVFASHGAEFIGFGTIEGRMTPRTRRGAEREVGGDVLAIDFSESGRAPPGRSWKHFTTTGVLPLAAPNR